MIQFDLNNQYQNQYDINIQNTYVNRLASLCLVDQLFNLPRVS